MKLKPSLASKKGIKTSYHLYVNKTKKTLTRQIQKSYYDKKFSTEYDYTVFMERLKLFSKVPLPALLIFLQNSEEYFPNHIWETSNLVYYHSK